MSTLPFGTPQTRIVPELGLPHEEAVFDRISFSALEGTFLNTALRGDGRGGRAQNRGDPGTRWRCHAHRHGVSLLLVAHGKNCQLTRASTVRWDQKRSAVACGVALPAFVLSCRRKRGSSAWEKEQVGGRGWAHGQPDHKEGVTWQTLPLSPKEGSSPG